MGEELANTTLEIRGIVTRKRRWPIVLGATSAAIVLALGGSGWAYASHYSSLALPNTLIGTNNIGGMSPAEVKRSLTDNCQKLQVTFQGDVANQSLSLGQAGLECDVPGTTAEVMSSNANLGTVLASTVMERKVQAKSTIDNMAATKAARSLTADLEGGVKDPGLIFDEANSLFIVDPGTPGKGVDPQLVIDGAKTAWETQSNQSVKVALTEVQPLQADPKLATWAEQANALIAPRVYLIGRGIGHTIPLADKAKWIEIAESGPVVNESAVLEWLKAFTNENVDVNNEPGERQMTKDGYLLTMTKMALDSKKVSNNEAIAAEIVSALNAGENYRGVFELEIKEGSFIDTVVDQNLPKPPYQAKPGEKFISVDLSNHTVAAWEGDQVVWGPVEAVHGSLPAPTYPGIFHVQSKQASSHMVNEKAWDGAYDTWSPWTMYYNGGYAVHGTYTRWNWVQTNYGGSHGCVNLKPAKAKELFDWASVGTPVVIHRAGVL